MNYRRRHKGFDLVPLENIAIKNVKANKKTASGESQRREACYTSKGVCPIMENTDCSLYFSDQAGLYLTYNYPLRLDQLVVNSL